MEAKLDVLLIGSGGREHALAYKITQSPLLGRLYIAPGNPGTAGLGENVALDPLDGPSLAEFALAHKVGLVVVGPEAPLAEGVADVLRQSGIAVVGPGKDGAILESSKEWSKHFMQRHHIPTAAFRSFGAAEMDAALAYISGHRLPVVIKASGLAAGKGVVICSTQAEALACVRDMLGGNAFGEAGATIVVEEFLAGIEVSVFALCDGKNYVLLPEAKDYKRIGEGDTGLNTGGMGAVSPVPFADGEFMRQVIAQVIDPTVNGLRQEGIDYRGFIFFGLIKVGGKPYVIEYNARMGDPETEVVMPRIASDFLPVLLAAAQGDLAGHEIEVKAEHAVTVVLVSGGYPGDFKAGYPIGLGKPIPNSVLFHSGTRQGASGVLETKGGRVFAATGLGMNLEAARAVAYAAAAEVDYLGKVMRRDIGLDLLG